MELPASLINSVATGKAVIVLGAGASMEAVNSSGKHAPSSKKLASLIAEKFLGPEYQELPLAEVSELAIHENDLFTVQEFIAQIFEELIPQESHIALTGIKWSGLATTNFDRLVEKAYEKSKDSRVQELKPFIQNGDRVADSLRDQGSVPYLKLHGCISRINDPSCQLILSIDQYVQYRTGRSRVFQHFLDWGAERTMIFIGQSLRDPDLRAVLLELDRECPSRPRYYAITPSAADAQVRFWESKKITTIRLTFSQFMLTLNSQLPQHFRSLSEARASTTPLDRKIRVKDQLFSNKVRSFLSTDVQYVNELVPTGVVDPKDFYRGLDRGWASIAQDLDVRRRISDVVISDHLLVDHLPKNRMQFVVLKGHAGSGKSVILRRIAWDASHDYDCVCLFLDEMGRLDASAVREIVDLCKERIFIFIDDIVDRFHDIDTFANSIVEASSWITVIAAARINEWNAECNEIADLLTGEYTIGYLSETEIDSLLTKLELHKSLGTLATLSLEERRHSLKYQYGRQLLVALHEATSGKPFEEIIKDEYESISPIDARELYLTVCSLNKFGAPVRAGVISRLHGIPFEQFKERFLLPLERVVIHSFIHQEDDFVYRARHPLIADLVFTTVANTPKLKYQLYSHCLTGLNIDYSSDRETFRHLIRSRTLMELLINQDDIRSLLEYAEKVAPDEAYTYQQRAIFEMNRANGNLTIAAECLSEAQRLEPHNVSILHSQAELSLRRAEKARTILEKEKNFDSAAASASALIRQLPSEPHGYHTLCKVYLQRIKIYSSDEKYDDMVTLRTVAKMEQLLSDALQIIPDDPYLLDADASLAQILSDSTRARASLSKAFTSDPRASYSALRLARILLSEDNAVEAQAILQKAIEAKPNDKLLRFSLCKILIEYNPNEHDTIIYHLIRSFSPGDRNYLAQLLYGRSLYISGRINEANAFFREQRQRRLPSALSFKPIFEIPNTTFAGEVIVKQYTYGFIARDKTHDRIFFGPQSTNYADWDSICQGDRVNFKIGFTARGPSALNVTRI